MTKIRLLSAVIAGFSTFALADDIAVATLKQNISQAITQFEQTPREQWSYRISRYENEEGDVTSSIELFDPAKEMEKRWSLLQINGETPTEKQLKKFTKDKVKKASKKEKGNISIALQDIVQLEGMQLIDEKADNLRASFDVNLERLGDKASQSLQGVLTYNKNAHFIETIEITNTDTFSPVFSAKITDFKLTFRFVKIDEAVLPHEHELQMKGTFAFFTEIDEVSKDTISDYRFVGE